ncbi:MAG: HD domain-containing protein [Campylobacterales bacterium]|nr:HD domain-containing protein [Campylobacterales bacterium]
MNYIEFLGTSGTRTPTEGTTCLRVSHHCVIDAGNLIGGLGHQLLDIEHIFLSHSHLDHIVDIPFVADLFVTEKHTPLKIYGLKETLEDLHHFIFNHRIWPNFEEIDLLEYAAKTIELIEISLDTPYCIDDITLTPFKTNHTDGSCGYVIKHENHSLLFTSDTYKCPKIWELIDSDETIHTLVIDVSFPSAYQTLAHDSKHLTPQLLAEEIALCRRKDFKIFPMHFKAQFKSTIIQELEILGVLKNRGHVLEIFSRLAFDPLEALPPSLKEKSIISKIIAIGTALSAEKNIETLLEMIIVQTKQLTGADGGTLYLYHPLTHQLEFKVIQNDSLNIQMGGTGEKIAWKPLDLFDEDNNPNRHMVAVLCALDGITINIPDVYTSTQYDFNGTMKFDQQTGYHSESMLVLPLKDHEDNLIGVLQLINKKDQFGKTIPFESHDEELALSLGSQAAVTLTKQRLINDLELLLESFLNTINVAIEEKSPYTAGHIDRMVQLSLMIARAMSDDDLFPDIHYDEDQLKEIKFSALMHDIGKITTPEQVIDKSTKLESIYDRIEEIKLKYEILKRDAYISFLSASPQSEERYKEEIALLDTEYLFLINANKGGEFFSDENIYRIREIAKRTFILNNEEQPLLSEDEVNNLIVQKGTLTEGQRHIINNHAAVSLRMLKELPFPKKLERVAEIAGGHHEKINGKGYPLGLKGDQLSIEARILAIADIFEALSASDRPYKKAKKLSESMQILYFMAKDEDVDRRIFRFFYESGLYLRYAYTFLKPENIDDVHITFDF